MENEFITIIQVVRAILILPCFLWKDELFMMDLARWKQILHLDCRNMQALSKILWNYPEFRNILIYRKRKNRIYKIWISLIYKPIDTLFIMTKEIGGGLFIQHGFATIISAEKIGTNCWINQQVTIGYKGNNKAPIIGDNVMITSGAKVLGPIAIGNNVVIGANAVVVHDVECDAVMGGVPAKRIK